MSAPLLGVFVTMHFISTAYPGKFLRDEAIGNGIRRESGITAILVGFSTPR